MLHTPYQSRHLGYWALGSQNSCYIHLEPHRNHSVHPHTINQILISNPYTSQLYIRTLHSHLILILMHARASRLLGLRLISRIFSVRMISWWYKMVWSRRCARHARIISCEQDGMVRPMSWCQFLSILKRKPISCLFLCVWCPAE